MAQHAYCGRRSACELLARLRAAPKGLAGDAEADAKGELVRALAGILERLVAEIAKLSSRIEHDVAELPDGKIVASPDQVRGRLFPRAGRICAAQILAELGPAPSLARWGPRPHVRERFQTDDQLAAEAGACPVTHASGKSRGVTFRWACDHRLRQAITCFANNSRHASTWAATIYVRARFRGCKHQHAVRTRARACVLWRAWQNRAAYDPQQHAGAANIAA